MTILEKLQEIEESYPEDDYCCYEEEKEDEDGNIIEMRQEMIDFLDLKGVKYRCRDMDELLFGIGGRAYVAFGFSFINEAGELELFVHMR